MNNFTKCVSLAALVICFILRLSHASESCEITDPNEIWWQQMRMQKSTNEMYELRRTTASSFTDEQNNLILYAGAYEGHPLANIEIAERIFIPYVKEMGSVVINFVRPDCHDILPPEIQYSNPIITSIPTTPTFEELNLAKDYMKIGLKDLLNPINNEYDVTLVCSLGI